MIFGNYPRIMNPYHVGPRDDVLAKLMDSINVVLKYVDPFTCPIMCGVAVRPQANTKLVFYHTDSRYDTFRRVVQSDSLDPENIHKSLNRFLLAEIRNQTGRIQVVAMSRNSFHVDVNNIVIYIHFRMDGAQS